MACAAVLCRRLTFCFVHAQRTQHFPYGMCRQKETLHINFAANENNIVLLMYIYYNITFIYDMVRKALIEKSSPQNACVWTDKQQNRHMCNLIRPQVKFVYNLYFINICFAIKRVRLVALCTLYTIMYRYGS